MQTASFLSDLKSLSVCPHQAALNLVTVYQRPHPDPAPNSPATESTKSDAKSTSDPDLQRANDLVSLHYAVKVKHQESGLDEDFLQARRDVSRVISWLTEGR